MRPATILAVSVSILVCVAPVASIAVGSAPSFAENATLFEKHGSGLNHHPSRLDKAPRQNHVPRSDNAPRPDDHAQHAIPSDAIPPDAIPPDAITPDGITGEGSDVRPAAESKTATLAHRMRANARTSTLATVVGRPSLEVTVSDNHVVGGEEVTLGLVVSNAGDLDQGGPQVFEEQVKTARNVRISIDEQRFSPELADALTVRTGDVLAGSIPEGVAGPFQFTHTASHQAWYATLDDAEFFDFSQALRTTVTLVVEDRARFDTSLRVANSETVLAGDTATVRVAVTNRGTRPATNVNVVLSTANSSLFFGNLDNPQQRQTIFLDSLAPNETRVFRVRVGADRQTSPGAYPLVAAVQYENDQGISRTADPLSLGIPVAPRQTFSLPAIELSSRRSRLTARSRLRT